MQAIMTDFCRMGYFEHHIKRINRIYKRRMQLALQTLEKESKINHIKWTKPVGGYLIWFKLFNLSIDEEELMEIIERLGVNVNPGSRFCLNDPSYKCFRLTISKLNDEETIL